MGGKLKRDLQQKTTPNVCHTPEDRRLSNDMQISVPTSQKKGTALVQCLWCCATNRKIAGSIPAGVIGIFH
jgi:hypothetical protein